MIAIDLQIETTTNPIPLKREFERWVAMVFADEDIQQTVPCADFEICIRLVDPVEITSLNEQYRSKGVSTNILSFPYDWSKDLDEIPLLGDLVICPAVVEQEAKEQAIEWHAHFAHIVIHGVLHLLGYDHIVEADWIKMEALEQKLLSNLIV